MQRQIRPAAERLVQFYQIGGSGGPVERRGVGTNVLPSPSGGMSSWKRFLTHPATTPIPFYSPTTVYNWGVRRFHLKNPFGNHSGTSQIMRFDQYIEANEGWTQSGTPYPRVPDLADEFVETWKPVVEGSSGGLGDPVEVCAYIGALNVTNTGDSLYGNDRFRSLFLAENFSELEIEINRSLAPMLACGMTIGADASVGLPDNGYEFDFYKKLKNGEWNTEWGSTRVYVESRPRADKPKWAEFDILLEDSYQHDFILHGCNPPVGSTASWWFRSNSDTNCPQSKSGSPPVAWGIPTRLLFGERVRELPFQSGVSLQYIIERTRRMLLQGDTVVTNLRPFIQNNISFSSLIEGVDDYIATRGPMPDETQLGYKTRNAAKQSTLVELINSFRNLI
jgi:hypothetical protein